MPTMWNSFPVECRGGLVTDVSPLQLAMNQPGAARKLVNFEPSVEGGYRRIQGFVKYDENTIDPYGEIKIQGGSQTGTTIDVANIFQKLPDGSTISIAGVSGTFEVTSSTYNSTNKTSTLTLDSSVSPAPADGAAVTVSNDTSVINGLYYFCEDLFAFRNTDLWKSSGSGWTKVSVPDHGTVLVDGGSQTGTSLDVDGLDSAPQVGDTFTIDGVNLVYTVTASPTVTSGAATLTIAPALDSSPANDAAITFLSADVATTGKVRFINHTFDGTPTIVAVNGSTAPFKYDDNGVFSVIDAPSDAVGAEYIAEFANHIFYAKGTALSFTAPFTDDDFSSALGGNVIAMPYNITGLIAFRDQLIIFTSRTIHRLVGRSSADFVLRQITEDLGCIYGDTIQEVGSDVVFLSQDGVRYLSATERIGDFNIALASRQIFNNITDFRSNWDNYDSLVVRGKNQYRIFGHSDATTTANSRGWVATQFADQTSEGMAWAELHGIKAYVSHSIYCPTLAQEVITFAHNDGYVYRMEQESSFDGSNIKASYWTPFLVFDDPRLRKNIYKLSTYFDPEGTIQGSVSLVFDYDSSEKIQPNPISFTNASGSTNIWGSGVWGTMVYGAGVKFLFRETTVGSGFNVSFQYEFNNQDEPFSIDVVLPEYAIKDRR